MYINAEEYLSDIESLKRHIDNKKRMLKAIKDETTVSGISYDIDRIRKAPKRDRLEEQILDSMERRKELQAKIETELSEMFVQQDEAIRYISMIESKDQQEVLMLRYIEGKQWTEIMELRGCDDLSGQYKLHKRAVASLQKIFNVYSMSI